MSYPSLKTFERTLPEHYRRWVRSGIIAAALGYSIVAVTRGEFPWEAPEGAVALICWGLLYTERSAPRLSGYLALLIIWAELMSSLVTTSAGIRSSSPVALPIWIVAVALFFGKRWTWIATALTCTAVVAAVVFVQPLILGTPYSTSDNTHLVVVVACLVSAAWLVTTFMGTLVAAVRRDRASASRAAQLVEKAPDAMVGVAEGNIVAFNALAELYFNLQRDEVLGKSIATLPIWEGTTPNLASDEVERLRDIEIGVRTLEMRIQKLEHEGELAEQLLVFRDVTERAEAEKRSRELQVQLEHAQRLEAIGQLAGGIAHDFNNLLTAFSGTAELLLDSDDDEVKNLAEGLAAASDRGAALTRQLLTFARREVVQARVLDLSQVVEGSRTLLSHLLGERITLDFDLQDGCLIEADHAQLEQILLNLGANARDAMIGPGTLAISTSAKDDEVLLIARDTGRGMEEAIQERIFEPFFTTKARDKGTGLGLSTVHGIVTHWKGRIEVQSQVGTGTAFTIFWPRAKADESKLETLSRPPQRAALTGNVLLVEDNDAARDITARLLVRSGFTVTTATSAEEALALARDGLHADILVSDVVMRGLTGVDLAERLRKSRPDLPVLFISGYVDDVLRDWPFDTTEDLLLKPFAGEELLERIQKKLKPTTGRVRLVGED